MLYVFEQRYDPKQQTDSAEEDRNHLHYTEIDPLLKGLQKLTAHLSVSEEQLPKIILIKDMPIDLAKDISIRLDHRSENRPFPIIFGEPS